MGDFSVELVQEPEVAMELVVEKLKLLHYERDFLTQRRPNWPPLTRTYFARPAGNGGEQFHYFTSLAAHLLRLAGSGFTAPAQFDDPNAACASIFAELAECGFVPPSFAPGKLKHGHGKEVVGVLAGLCDLVVSAQYKRWNEVQHENGRAEESGTISTEFQDDEDVNDALNRTYGSHDGIENDAATDEESDEDELFLAHRNDAPPTPQALRADRKTEWEREEAKAIEIAVDASEWKLELERVAPHLKVLSLTNDGKDWRVQLDAAKKHVGRINETFPDVRKELESISSEVNEALAKIDQLERFVNDQLEPLVVQYKHEREKMVETQQRYDTSSETVADLTNELARVGEKLEQVKTSAAAGAENIADNSPLVDLKASIDVLRSEIEVMEIRINVVSNTLLGMDLKRNGDGKEN